MGEDVLGEFGADAGQLLEKQQAPNSRETSISNIRTNAAARRRKPRLWAIDAWRLELLWSLVFAVSSRRDRTKTVMRLGTALGKL